MNNNEVKECKHYCPNYYSDDIGYEEKDRINACGLTRTGYHEMSYKKCSDITNCYFKQLQTAKEELQAYKEDRFCQGGCTVYQFDKIKQLKEENEKLTQQNKQMRETLENVKFEAKFNGNDESLQKIINIIDNTLKGVE